MNDFEYFSKEEKLRKKIFELEGKIEQGYLFVESLSTSTSIEAKKISIKHLREIKKLEEELSNVNAELDGLKKEYYSSQNSDNKSDEKYPAEVEQMITDAMTAVDLFEQSNRKLAILQARREKTKKEIDKLTKQSSQNEEIEYFINVLKVELETLNFEIEINEKQASELEEKSLKAVANLHDALHCLSHGTWKPKQME